MTSMEAISIFLMKGRIGWQMTHTGWRASQRLRDAAQVGNDGLDAIPLAFDLGLKALHLVAVEGVGDILCLASVGSRGRLGFRRTYPTNVNVSHGSGEAWKISRYESKERRKDQKDCREGRKYRTKTCGDAAGS